jgi:cytochrome c oxidase assembly protein subunit 15
MAFPDWPTSLGSYNLINPVDRWWAVTPYLAEHGHRLIASVVGFLTIGLAVWTWRADPRRWMRRLGWAALALVIFQGVLGGLRVLWISLDLAVVHASVAQIFFATLVAMTLFTTRVWRERRGVLPEGATTTRFRRLALLTTGLIYLQIVLGALLRHPGRGVDGVFAGIHITGAFLVTGLVFALFVMAQKHYASNTPMTRATSVLVGTVGLQFALGLAAYVLMLYEAPEGIRSTAQVVLTVGHLVVGALLFGSAVVTTLLARRAPALSPSDGAVSASEAASDPVLAVHES